MNASETTRHAELLKTFTHAHGAVAAQESIESGRVTLEAMVRVVSKPVPERSLPSCEWHFTHDRGDVQLTVHWNL